MRRALVMSLTSVALAACLGNPQADPTAFFLLSPPPVDAPGTPVPVSIGVGPVTLPGYLDRPQVVTRLSDNEIALAETDRWAEPLQENLVRTLEETLAGLLPGSSFVDYPWYPAEAPDYALALEVRRFEGDSSGAVTLDATWTLSRATTRVDGRAVRMVVPAEQTGRAASIAAHSRALAEVCKEIAVTLRRVVGR